MDEARLEHTEYGLAPASDGWFTVSIPGAAWVTSDEAYARFPPWRPGPPASFAGLPFD